MKTGSQTTHIMLERGVEDWQICKEMAEVIRELRLSERDFYMRYPALRDLLQGLRQELRDAEL